MGKVIFNEFPEILEKMKIQKSPKSQKKISLHFIGYSDVV